MTEPVKLKDNEANVDEKKGVDPDEPPPLPADLSEQDRKYAAIAETLAQRMAWAVEQRAKANAKGEKVSVTDGSDVYGARRRNGAGAGIIAILGVFGAYACTQLMMDPIDPSTLPNNEHAFHLAMVVTAVRGAVTIAFIGFCAWMLGLAERLSIPHWWVTKLKDIRPAIGAPRWSPLPKRRRVKKKASDEDK